MNSNDEAFSTVFLRVCRTSLNCSDRDFLGNAFQVYCRFRNGTAVRMANSQTAEHQDRFFPEGLILSQNVPFFSE